MHNRLNLCRADTSPLMGRDDDRGFGWRSIAYKHRGFGRRQMHAGGLNRVDLLNAARQLLLDGGVVAHLFHELAGGHGRLVFERIQARGGRFG